MEETHWLFRWVTGVVAVQGRESRKVCLLLLLYLQIMLLGGSFKHTEHTE